MTLVAQTCWQHCWCGVLSPASGCQCLQSLRGVVCRTHQQIYGKGFMLCHAVLCCAVLCCDVPCCAMLCCVQGERVISDFLAHLALNPQQEVKHGVSQQQQQQQVGSLTISTIHAAKVSRSHKT